MDIKLIIENNTNYLTNFRQTMPSRTGRVLVGLAVMLSVSPTTYAAPEPTVARNGMVVSVSTPASEVGCVILKKGGNAVDAAIATQFALAVTHPAAGNIGGGGFMVVFPSGGAAPAVVEYRETAPAAATRTMFAANDSHYGCKPVGVPGSVRGMALAHQKFGTLPWKDLVQPAVRLAEEGFPISKALARSLNWVVDGSQEFPELRRVLGKKNGSLDWQAGDRLIQKDLARTLRLIAEEGPDAFYKGTIADLICAEMKAGQGLITKADLAAYQAHVRAPIHGTYRGYDVYSSPPPSSGGTCLVEMLNVLENFDLRKHDRWSPQTLHLMIETMRRVYCDRARYLGDADFVQIPARLTDKEYARTLAASINEKHATASLDLAKDIPIAREGDSTTHFSVIDKNGMAVANTTTLEHSYGSRVVVHGAGFLLNNEMTDFNWTPGVTDQKGRIGTKPNQIAPGKRMLSSQTPTIVARDGKVVLVTGSPGSRSIINTVLCILINVLDFEMDIRAAVDAPRLNHAWLPDIVKFEGMRANTKTTASLSAMGHRLRGTKQGDAHSIWVDRKTGAYHGAADRRIDGCVAGY